MENVNVKCNQDLQLRILLYLTLKSYRYLSTVLYRFNVLLYLAVALQEKFISFSLL